MRCYYQPRKSGDKTDKWVQFDCEECGENANMMWQTVMLGQKRRKSEVLLCKRCANSGRYRKLPTGQDHGCYKGGLTCHGYRRLRVNGKMLYEHRVEAEKKLGRELDSHELVHHIDCNKLNNSHSNLWVCPDRKAHEQTHFTMQKVGFLLLNSLIWYDDKKRRYVLTATTAREATDVLLPETKQPKKHAVATYSSQRINGRKAPVHVWVMEKMLGRKLFRDECVHHIDGNKQNNKAINLQVMTSVEHRHCHESLEQCVGTLYNTGHVNFISGEYLARRD